MRGARAACSSWSPISQAGAEQVIDARANERYQGKVAEPRPGLRSGHIPGSLSLPYNNLFDAATGTMKSLDELRAAFLGAGVKLDAPIVTSCGSGVSAAVLTLALYRLGVENPALYDGSWTEWGAARRPAGRDRSGLTSSQRLPRGARASASVRQNGLGCCCCRVSAASRASRARRAARSAAAPGHAAAARFLTALRSGFASWSMSFRRR